MNRTASRHASPGPSSTQDQGDGVPCENSSQAGEVRVAVGRLLEHSLIQLQLRPQKKKLRLQQGAEVRGLGSEA